ncbi:hypothetical protein SCUP234_06458 [Seiridium cupressi]
MSTKDENSQFQFLINCIKNSNNGKVDFTAVAEQLGIVSKGAAAKRYERLMKAHGISATGNAGPSTPKKAAVKKEKDAGTRKPAPKKRKLQQVDEDAGDEDEPIKGEVKSEIKFEDAITVKTEQSNGGVAALATRTSELSTQPDKPQQISQDEEDDVLVVSSTEKTDNHTPIYGSDHHHHLRMSAQHIPGIHSFDYAANLGYPVQTTPTMMMAAMPRASSGTPLPYGFGPPAFIHNHDHSGLFWQGSHMMTPHPDGQHREDKSL